MITTLPRTYVMSDDEIRQKSERDIYEVLTRDQCVHGFEHTQEQIGLWLGGCDKEGRKALLIHLTELDIELDSLNR